LKSRRFVRLPILAASVLLVSLPAMADVWHHAVSAAATVEYDSNPDLSPTEEEGVWRFRFVPSYDLTGTFGVDEFRANFKLNLERSTDQSLSEDREDPSLALGWRRQTETGEFGLNARYEEISTRVSELDANGLVNTDGTRTTQAVSGNWRSALGALNTLSADAEYRDVAYAGGIYTDYTNLSGGLTYGHSLSERSEAFLRATASHYTPDDKLAASSSSYYGLLGGMKWQASERLDWTVQAGASSITGNDDDTGWQGSLVLNYLTLRSDLALDIGRTISPSGEGGVAESDQIKGVWSYALGERTRAGIDAAWRDYRGDTPNTLRQLGAWVSRELTPFWNTRLYWQYKQRQEDGQPDASANLVGLMLAYTHPDF